MVHVERAAMDELPAMWEIDALTTGGEERRAYLLESVQSKTAYIARQGFEVRGFAVRNTTFYGYPFIALIATHPDYRRQGVARALLAYLEKTCPSDRLFTSMQSANTAARALFESSDYVKSGEIHHVNPDEEWVYVKFLD